MAKSEKDSTKSEKYRARLRKVLAEISALTTIAASEDGVSDNGKEVEKFLEVQDADLLARQLQQATKNLTRQLTAETMRLQRLAAIQMHKSLEDTIGSLKEAIGGGSGDGPTGGGVHLMGLGPDGPASLLKATNCGDPNCRVHGHLNRDKKKEAGN